MPQLGSCASSGRAWRLWAARHSQEAANPLRTQPLPRLLELAAASNAADVIALDYAGVLKSLVFMVGDSAVLVIARGCDRISLPLLEHHCGAAPNTARLGTPAEAAATTGFAPGCIPPLLLPGLPRVPVLMDEQVLRSQAPVYAGAGVHGDHLSIAPHELRRAANAIVAELVDLRASSKGVDAPLPRDTDAQLVDASVSRGAVGASPHAVAAAPAAPAAPRPQQPAAALVPPRGAMGAAPLAQQTAAAPLLPVMVSSAPLAAGGSAAPLPLPLPARSEGYHAERHYVLSGTQYVEVMTADTHGRAAVLIGVGGLPDAPVGVSGYPDEPHHKKVSAAVWTHLADTAISHDEEVEQLEVVRVRRQGRLLAFASVRELGYTQPEPESEPAEVGAAPDGGYAAVDVPKRRPPIGQLIAGRMFSTQVGEESAAAVLRQVKAGSVVTVRGRVQRNPREADCDEPTTADMVARCLEIRSQPSRPPANRAEAKRDGHDGFAAAEATVSKPGLKSKSAALNGFNSGASLLPTDTLALPTAQCVDDATSLRGFCAAVDGWCASSATIGLDCEWRPRRLDAADGEDGEDSKLRAAAALPVAVLQLASSEEAFVIDILTLSRTGADGEAMAALCGAVGALFRCAASTKLGFASKGDTDRLEAALRGP